MNRAAKNDTCDVFAQPAVSGLRHCLSRAPSGSVATPTFLCPLALSHGLWTRLIELAGPDRANDELARLFDEIAARCAELPPHQSDLQFSFALEHRRDAEMSLTILALVETDILGDPTILVMLMSDAGTHVETFGY